MSLQFFIGVEGNIAFLASEEFNRSLVLFHMLLQVLQFRESHATILTF